MTGERVVRRLAAILAADVAGYSRLMGRDENGTLTRLRAHRTERLEPTVARHGGRLVKLTGDGALIEFPSAVDALHAAIAFQQAMAEANHGQSEDTAIVFRVGLHLGDLIVEGDDLYGDGVNVAARLEAEAPPGGIVVSRAIREAVEGRLKAKLHTLGELALKNIERPICAFRVEWDAADWKATEADGPRPAILAEPPTSTLALPDKPSIAVLPFQNMSGDPEQEYFADGMAEDITTALSRFPSLFVIARNSSFSYKGQPVDVRRVGRELGVRYLLEGSVRKSGSRVRITSQLVEAISGAHVWADRHDGTLNDVFQLQDEITERVAGAIAPSIERAEIRRVQRKPPEEIGAHDLYLRALPLNYALTRQGLEDARELLRQAIALDAGYSPPHTALAMSFGYSISQAWIPRDSVRAEVMHHARRGVELDKEDADALAALGRLTVYFEGRHEEALSMVSRALSMNANSVVCLHHSGWTHLYAGQSETAVAHLQRALRMNPRDPLDYTNWSGLSIAFIQMGRDEEALRAAREALDRNQLFTTAWRAYSSSLALLGQMAKAREAMAELLRLDPQSSLTGYKSQPSFTEAARERYWQGLLLAGLPK